LAVQWNAVKYFTRNRILLHYITLHYITLHYTKRKKKEEIILKALSMQETERIKKTEKKTN